MSVQMKLTLSVTVSTELKPVVLKECLRNDAHAYVSL